MRLSSVLPLILIAVAIAVWSAVVTTLESSNAKFAAVPMVMPALIVSQSESAVLALPVEALRHISMFGVPVQLPEARYSPAA